MRFQAIYYTIPTHGKCEFNIHVLADDEYFFSFFLLLVLFSELTVMTVKKHIFLNYINGYFIICFKFQVGGGRFYTNAGVDIKGFTIDTLKIWNKEKMDIKFDRKFVSLLLLDVIGVEILKISSVHGLKAHNGLQHVSLDTQKLNLVSAIFTKRVRNENVLEPGRASNLTEIINRHCTNSRSNEKKKMKKTND